MNILPDTLEGNSQFEIKVSFNNFVGKEESNIFVLNTRSSSGPSVGIVMNQSFNFNNFDKNFIIANYKYLACDSSFIEEGETIDF